MKPGTSATMKKTQTSWREAHVAAFGRQLAKVGMEFCDDMTVVCEEFEVVYNVG
ncbi:MAG: hypothetical protein ACM3ZR_12870 [Pseudomonadota bacterium]